jgi:hypothetical protein
MLLTILIVIAALILALLVFAATRPDTFQVSRAATVQAPPEKIYPLISDFHRWGAWSPWEKLDPALKRTHSGAANGKGAVYAWVGNKKVGEGRMEILEASSPSKVKIQLDFLKPFEAHNTAEFTLNPQGGSTNITWDMYGQHNFFSKVMCAFVSMDRMVGKDFEAGLSNLKTIAEK